MAVTIEILKTEYSRIVELVGLQRVSLRSYGVDEVKESRMFADAVADSLDCGWEEKEG